MVLTEEDYKLIEICKDILPGKVFDAHAHCYCAKSIPTIYGSGTFDKEFINSSVYEKDLAPFFPNSSFFVNMIPMPDVKIKTDKSVIDIANDNVINLVKNNEKCVGSVYVDVTDSEQRIGDLVANKGIKALKCYHYSSPNPDPETCAISDFLPQSAWVVANEKSMPIILHMMRFGALSDSENLDYVNKMTEKYPNAKLVLAHCGRSFAPHTVIRAMDKLSDNENIWFDTAAICESPSIIACLKKSKKRVVWGTDYPICLNIGKPIGMGAGFCWITGDNLPPSCKPAHLIAESLIAHKLAFSIASFDQTDINAVFYDNACKLFSF
ncbi:MAG: hypothetical protein E7353_08570 [Clostridiales bacterium]|nr:hypothetical protein [Clostridiales bacterium]